MTLTAKPRLLIRFAVLAALALCVVVLALSSTGTPPVGAQDGSVPAKPTGVVTTATHDSVALAWDDPSDASITHYQIFRRDRDIHDAGEFVTITENTGSAAASYTDDTVEPEKRYVYRVKAVNQHGASTWSNFVRANTPAAPAPEPTPTPTPTPEPEPTPDPADLAPSGLEVSLVENRVTLTWDAPASDAASVTGYEILRRRPNDGEAALTTLVADTGNAETGYTDDSANEPGVSYTYRVKALRDGEQSRVSNYDRIDLPEDYAQDPPEPAPEPEEEPTPEALAPSGLTAEAAEDDGVALSWTAPAEDAASVTGYEVLRAQGSAELATLAADTSNTDTTYTDSGVTGDLDGYRYQVKALRGGDASQGSNVAGVLQSAHAGAIVPLADVTLISNVGQTAATGAAQVSTSQSQAQGFTTGSDSGGYTLGSVELAVSSFSGTASDITVSIYSESSGDPGTVVHTLTTPASISAAVTTFTAPSGATLAASTTYYVVISTTGSGISLGRTNAAAEDTGGVSGWSIADSRRFFGGSGWNTTTNPIRMRVNGDAATSTNSPATGAPTITGTPAVGELLTADISNIGDADGIADADFKYQWIAFDGTTDSDISGATGETYRPLLAHLAQTIKVRVSFDDDDNAESLTSAATAAVTASTYGQVIWAATLTVEEVIDSGETYVGFDSNYNQGSLEPSDFSYDGNNISVLWLYYEDVLFLLDVSLPGYSGLGSGSFNLYLDDSAFLIQDPASNLDEVFRFPDHGLSWTDGQEVEVRLTVNRAPTAGPTITGDVQVGGTLTADPSAIVDPDGIAIGATYTYQWVRVDGMSETNISGATASTYTLVADDGGKTIKVKVSYTDEANFVDTATSNATTKVATAPAPPTGVDITTEGNGELTVGWTAPTENGGSDITGYKVQWKSGTQSFGSSRQHTTADGAATSYTIPSLTNGTEYTVRVLAVNAVGDSAASNTDTGTPSTTPSAPTNVQASGNAELTVTWDAPDDGGSAITGYTVQWKSGTQSYNTTRQATVTTTTHTIGSLTNDTTYTLRVKATNANGDSGWTEITATPVSGPSVGTVTSGMITQTSAVITVTIANPDTNTQTVNLQYKRNADTNWTSGGTRSTVSAEVTFTLSSLTGNTDYDVRASLDSTFASGVVTAAFKTSPVKPAPPTGVDITTEGNGELTVGWTAPTENGGSDITGYKVQWKSGTQSFGSSRQHTTADGAATSYTIPSLTNGTEYTVRVLAVNAVGDSAASNTDTGTPSTTPSAPTNVQASGNAELTVTWDAPDDGGSAITGYTVQWKSGTQSYNTTRQATVTTTTHTIGSLTNDTTYTLRVKATNANGDSGWTEITATPVSGPSVGTVTSGMITQTSAVITVTIANPDTNTQTVNLQYKRNADTNWTSGGTRSTVSAAVTFTLSSLTGNTDYDVRASLDSTFASGVVTAAFKTSPVKPAPPTGVDITTEGNGELTVGWTAPTENGGSDITGYKVQWKSGAQSFGTARSTLTADGAATSYTIPSLTNGTEYTVRVLAVNAAGDSAASNTDTGTPSTTPSAPTNVLASGNAELTVTWDAPNDGGSAITGYTVQWKSGTQSYNTTRQATVTTTTHTIGSLTNDTTYTLRVKATNANGDSGWTEITGTPVSGPSVGTVTSGMITKTSAVITVTISNPDTNSQTVNLQYKRNADTNWTSGGTRSTVSAEVTFTLSSLTGNTDYDLRASLDSNFASGVVTATFKTSPVKPAPPTGVDITTEGNGELTVGWTAPTENGGSDITGYKVQWKSGAQSFGSSRQHTTADGAATSYTIPSLTNGTLYTVRVLAVNSVGDSAASNTDTGTPSTTPSAPTNVQAGSGHQQLTVSWGAPNDGGSAITEYTLQWKSGGQGFNSTRQRTIAGTSRTDTIPSLSNGTEYTVRVRATNALGDSDWSAEAKGTPREGPHVSLVKVKEPIECDNTQVVVTLANLVAGTEYEVHLRDRKQGDPWPSTATHARSLTGDTSHGTSVSFTLTRLDGNTVYEVQASLDGSFNSGVVTATFTTPAEEPDPPTNVRITGDTNNSLTVSWNPPSYDGGSAVTEYRVQWLTVGEGFANARRDGREAVVDASARSHTITGLSTGEFYQVRVLAVNGAGESEGSNTAWGFPGLGGYGHG